jgi:hypothetical protein
MEIDYKNHLFYKRFFVDIEEFKINFLKNDVNEDVITIPNCTIIDSMERWLDIYEKADLNFRMKLNKKDLNFSEALFEIGNLYGEEITFLNKRKIEFVKNEIFKLSNPSSQSPKKKAEYTIKQIALKYVYEGVHINRENAKEYVKLFGLNSGDRLYNNYCYYSSKSNRTGRERTTNKLKNKIELIERVIPLIEHTKNIERVNSELEILKNLFEAEKQ